ncbi:Fc.00g032570.m01.CDS01 [Cosmosporella sp. VM-42]
MPWQSLPPVVQFTDYGSRILIDARDIRRSTSGQVPLHAELTKDSQHLEKLLNEVERKLEASHSQQSGTEPGEQSQGMLRLCGECSDVNRELQEHLDALKAHGERGLLHAADSVAVAVKGAWSKSKIEGKIERIRQLEGKIKMNALITLWSNAEKEQTTSLDMAKRQVEMIRTLTTIDETTRKFGDELVSLVQGGTTQSRQGVQDIVKAVLDSDWKPSSAIHMQAQDEKSISSRDWRITNGIVDSLLFESIHHREEAILNKCLARNPKFLVPIVFPTRWSLLHVFDGRVTLPQWKPEELKAGFRALVSNAGRKIAPEHEVYKLAIMIDGLDEFELERLTRVDIEHYVQAQFKKSRGFLERKKMFPDQAEKLLKDIADKALGVFLWVTVVVRNLLINLQEGDSLSTIQETLGILPDDLSNLFEVMWERTRPDYRREAAQYFAIMECFEKHDITPYAITFGLGDSKEVGLDLDYNKVDNSFLLSVVASFSRRLNSRTRCLLEIHQMGGVRESIVAYMHRTVREWIQENPYTLDTASTPDFNCNPWVLRGETLRLPIDNYIAPTLSPDAFWLHLDKLLILSRRAGTAPETVEQLVQTLDKLDFAITKLLRGKMRDGSTILHTISIRYPPGPWSLTSNISEEDTHWCNGAPRSSEASVRVDGWASLGQTSFTSLMTQIPVPQYIHSKLSGESAAVRAGGTQMPMLLNAVFGGCQAFPSFCNLGGPRQNDQTRQHIVKFLLDFVSLGEIEHALKLLQTYRKDLITRYDGRSQDEAYFKAVEEMLKSQEEEYFAV